MKKIKHFLKLKQEDKKIYKHKLVYTKKNFKNSVTISILPQAEIRLIRKTNKRASRFDGQNSKRQRR